MRYVDPGMSVYIAYSSFDHGNVHRYEHATVLVAAGDKARVQLDRGSTLWIDVDLLYDEAHVVADAARRLGAPG